MKKLLALALSCAMVLSLAACGSSGSSSGSQGGSSASGGTSSGSQTAGSGSTAAPPSSGETVHLRLWGAEEDQTLLRDLVEKFKSAARGFSAACSREESAACNG